MNASGPSSVGLASVGLDRLLKPRSIAIVGVSREGAVAGKMGGSAVLDSLLRGGYRGSLHLVHPDAPQIDGRQSWPSVSALPETPDLVVASLPATRIPDLAAECGARGVGAMVIISAGFSELGTEQGRNLEDQLRRAANGAGVRLCGPNGLGFVNVSDGGHFENVAAGVARSALPLGSRGLRQTGRPKTLAIANQELLLLQRV